MTAVVIMLAVLAVVLAGVAAVEWRMARRMARRMVAYERLAELSERPPDPPPNGGVRPRLRLVA